MLAITLQNKLIINNSISDKTFLDILKYTHEILQGFAFRIIKDSSLNTWEDFKYSHPTQYKTANTEITEMAKVYFRIKNYRTNDLSDRYKLSFKSFEVEVVKAKVDDLSATELAFYFYSKEYMLLSNFGSYLLLSENDEDDPNKQRNFMIEISKTLTIHTYSK